MSKSNIETLQKNTKYPWTKAELNILAKALTDTDYKTLSKEEMLKIITPLLPKRTEKAVALRYYALKRALDLIDRPTARYTKEELLFFMNEINKGYKKEGFVSNEVLERIAQKLSRPIKGIISLLYRTYHIGISPDQHPVYKSLFNTKKSIVDTAKKKTSKRSLAEEKTEEVFQKEPIISVKASFKKDFEVAETKQSTHSSVEIAIEFLKTLTVEQRREVINNFIEHSIK